MKNKIKFNLKYCLFYDLSRVLEQTMYENYQLLN